jgi:uncharacterized membrane protein
MEKFSKKEAINFGWEIAKKKILFFVLLLILVLGVPFALEFLFRLPAVFLLAITIKKAIIKKKFLILSVILFFLGAVTRFLLSLIFNLGLIKISLKFCDNEKVKFSDLISQYKLIFRYFLALILQSLIVVFGFLLFIIPGIIFLIRFGFYGYLIVDKNSKIVESLKRSWEITKGNTWNLFLFYLLLGLINVLGFLALIIGLFWSIPTTMLANAFVYRKLSEQLKVQNQEKIS